MIGSPSGTGPGQHWEVAELIAALDPTVAPRMLAEHPDAGWCPRCRVSAPCSSRTLAVAVQRAVGTGGDRDPAR